MGLWSRLNQCQVWQKLVGKLSDLHPLSFTEGLFHLCEMIDLALILEPEAICSLLLRLYEKLVRKILPVRQLRINRREVKQVYNKYKPKKRDLPAPKPFEPHERFLDFVDLLDPLVTCVSNQKGA
jgi:hypothetical protein